MRKLGTSIIALSLLATSVVVAQDPQKMVAQEEVVEILLLRQKAVQEDLKIDEAKAKTIREFCHKQHMAAEEVHKLPESQQKPQWEKMMKENEQFLATTLSADQRKRLEQITMQTAGMMWLGKPSVAKELKLTNDQQEKTKQMQQETFKRFKDIMHTTKGDARAQALSALHKTSEEQISKLLTDEQRTAWAKMVGAPFKGKLQHDEPDMPK